MTDRLTCGRRQHDPCEAVCIRVNALSEALNLLTDIERGIQTIEGARRELLASLDMAERDRWRVAA